MVEADPHKQPTLVEAALDFMRRRARQIGSDSGSHVEKQLMMDAMKPGEATQTASAHAAP